MRLSPNVTRIVPAFMLMVLAAFPAGATTLVREGLDKLTAANEMVVADAVGELTLPGFSRPVRAYNVLGLDTAKIPT